MAERLWMRNKNIPDQILADNTAIFLSVIAEYIHHKIISIYRKQIDA